MKLPLFLLLLISHLLGGSVATKDHSTQCFAYGMSAEERVKLPYRHDSKLFWEQTAHPPQILNATHAQTFRCTTVIYEIHWPNGQSSIEAHYTSQNKIVEYSTFNMRKDEPYCYKIYRHSDEHNLPTDFVTGAECHWKFKCECFTDFCNDIVFPREQYFVDNETKINGNEYRTPSIFFENAIEEFVLAAETYAIYEYDIDKYEQINLQPTKCHVDHVYEPFGKPYLKSINLFKDILYNTIFNVYNNGPMWCAVLINRMETSYGLVRIPGDIEGNNRYWNYDTSAEFVNLSNGIAISGTRVYCYRPTENNQMWTNDYKEYKSYKSWIGDELILCACGLDNCNNDLLNYKIRRLLKNHIISQVVSLSDTVYDQNEIFETATPKENAAKTATVMVPITLIFMLLR